MAPAGAVHMPAAAAAVRDIWPRQSRTGVGQLACCAAIGGRRREPDMSGRSLSPPRPVDRGGRRHRTTAGPPGRPRRADRAGCCCGRVHRAASRSRESSWHRCWCSVTPPKCCRGYRLGVTRVSQLIQNSSPKPRQTPTDHRGPVRITAAGQSHNSQSTAALQRTAITCHNRLGAVSGAEGRRFESYRGHQSFSSSEAVFTTDIRLRCYLADIRLVPPVFARQRQHDERNDP